MTSKNPVIDCARRVVEIEAEAITALIDKLDENFLRAVDIMLSSSGKVVVTGMGKSGLICQKIASTLASTGTSAFFLHPAEGLHGDLGVLMKNDVLLAISSSGETEEIVRILPAVKRLGIKTIILTGATESTIAGYGDAVLDVGVEKEACPLGLAPTSSSTAALVMGDCLAVALLERRGFKAEDFAHLHPAGSLGKKLKKVEQLMRVGESIPKVTPQTPMEEAVIEMSEKRLGVTGVFQGSSLVGVITDGDLRRALARGNSIFSKLAGDVMHPEPKVIKEGSLVESALSLMDEFSITSIFVTNGKDGGVIGILHLHDLIKAGVL